MVSKSWTYDIIYIAILKTTMKGSTYLYVSQYYIKERNKYYFSTLINSNAKSNTNYSYNNYTSMIETSTSIYLSLS